MSRNKDIGGFDIILAAFVVIVLILLFIIFLAKINHSIDCGFSFVGGVHLEYLFSGECE